MTERVPEPRALRIVEETGPWPFTSRRVLQRPDSGQFVWRSRHHRKGLHWFAEGEFPDIGGVLRRCLWMPGELNWWIGVIFAVGALFFVAGSVLSLSPVLAKALSLNATGVNAVYFAGSIPFTTAAYLQLYQAANAPHVGPHRAGSPRRRAVFGWAPGNIGWLSCALQFVGTLLFNVNTWDAMAPGLDWFQEDLAVWIPDFAGSVLFLVSGQLAFAETCHAHFAWKPSSLSWWITFANLLGCVAFMISAVFAFVPATPFAFDAATIAVVFTLLGAIGFVAGSLLMLPETVRPE